MNNNKDNHEKLNQIMEKHRLSVRDVSEILGVSQNRIYSWRTKDTWRRNMPDQMIELLKFRLNKKEVKW